MPGLHFENAQQLCRCAVPVPLIVTRSVTHDTLSISACRKRWPMLVEDAAALGA